MKPNSEYVKCAAGFGLGNKNDMAVLGYLITQTFTAVYRENKCIAIPLYKLSSCTGVARSTIWDSVIRLESRGCIEVERPKVRVKGSATTYRVCNWVMDKVAERKDGKAAKIVKRDENMDQVNELQRQIESLQAENARLQTRVDNAIKWWNETNGKMKALEAENARLKAGANGTSADGVVYDPVPDGWRAQTVDVPMNDGSTITRTKGEQLDIEMKKAGKHPLMRLVDAFGEVCRLRKENAELKKGGTDAADEALVQEVAKYKDKFEEEHNKFMASNDENFAYRNKIGGLKDEIRELKAEMAELEKKYKAAVQELDELKGAGQSLVTVEPEVPYGIMKPDELLHEISTVIKNRN